MADKFEEFDFEHYELIPRDETLREPISDQVVIMNSKPYNISRASFKTQETQTQSNNHNSQLRQKELNEKERIIQSLNCHIARVQNQLVQKRRQNNYLLQTQQKIKQLLGNPNLTIQQTVQQIQTLKNTLETQKSQIIALNQQIKQNKIEQNIKLLSKKQQQIHELKAKLLQSTTNNINAIFNTQLISQNKIQKTIYTQISQLKQQIKKMYCNLTYKNQCKHEQKIKSLIKNYQQMLTIYHKNQRNVEQLQNKHQQNIIYFSTLRRDINNQINQLYTNNTNKKLNQLQKQIIEIVDNLKNKPQRVRSQQEEDVKVKQLMNQLQILNQRLMHREIQVERMREANQQLIMRSQAYQKCQMQLSKMKQIQDKVKEKDKKINQLQCTIIQQMQSKVRTQSINSQQSDIQKQKNNVRNLKAIVSSLKQQNAALKAQLNNLSRQNQTLKQGTNASSSPQSDYLVERSSRDDGCYKVVENIVGVLVMASEGDDRGKCRCLEMVTDCLLNLNQEYPGLQGMLQNLGVMQKTSNLLPMQA